VDKTLLEKLKDVGKYYGTYHDLYLLCREAAEMIEEQYKEIRELAEENNRLAEKVGLSNSKFVEMAGKLKETNDKYNLVAKNNDELLKMYAPTVKERDKLIEENERLEALINFNNSKHTEVLNKYNVTVEENIRLEAEVKEVAHANDDLIKRNIALVTENNRLAVELNNLALASHSDRAEVNWNDELRDQFACAAMEGLVSNGIYNPESNARWAYQQADAMLKAREK